MAKEAPLADDAGRFSQMAIELILVRQLATYLATPVLIVDEAGTLVYYNEAAQVLLGKPYEENDELPLREWGTAFRLTGEDGQQLLPEDLPLGIALKEHRPAHLSPVLIQANDGVRRRLAVNAFPLIGHQEKILGAVAIFWEVGRDASNAVGH